LKLVSRKNLEQLVHDAAKSFHGAVPPADLSVGRTKIYHRISAPFLFSFPLSKPNLDRCSSRGGVDATSKNIAEGILRIGADGVVGNVFDHPVCASTVASQHFLDAQPPLSRGGD
jgi:hypothetical protein